MHDDEFEINQKLVKRLLKHQCPQWADLSVTKIPSTGTEYALYRLGDKYVMRLPRVEGAQKVIDKEFEWVPKLTKHLTTPISTPLFKGQADDEYPSPWLISIWNEGTTPDYEEDSEHQSLAIDLADFLNELHTVKLPGGPQSRRGIPLIKLDRATCIAVKQLNDELDTRAVVKLWDQLSQTPNWENEPVWIHGDFLPGNILVKNNRLKAVLDFSDVGIGDPASDLVIAWALLNSTSRQVFRDRLKLIDKNTWQRGRGWALSIAAIMLPYYKSRNPAMAKLARRIMDQILA